MNVKRAQEIAGRVARLAAIATTFCARYGRDYRLTDESPAAAWELYQQLMTEQTQIAQLLDTSSLANAYVRWGKWWESRDVINTGLVNEMANEAFRLVEHAAYLDALGADKRREDGLRVIQEMIAGLLHPVARQQGIERSGHALAEAV